MSEQLLREPRRFDFFQAVRLLERMEDASASVGEGVTPEREAVWFSSAVGMEFPGADILEVRRARRLDTAATPAPAGTEPAPWRMTVSFLGLAGAMGPLPWEYTEMILERLSQGDTAARSFLDIFNHRLVSLFYRVRRRHRVGLAAQAPEDTEVAQLLYALAGAVSEARRGALGVDERALAAYAGLLAGQVRSASALQALLADYFRVPVEVVQLQGRWFTLDEDQVTRIGAQRGQNQRLGEGAMLGTRVWDQQAALEVRVGPLALEEYREFLPDGGARAPLEALVRLYVGGELEFRVTPLLRRDGMPAFQLGEPDRADLGWTTYLRPRDEHGIRLGRGGEARLDAATRLGARPTDPDGEGPGGSA